MTLAQNYEMFVLVHIYSVCAKVQLRHFCSCFHIFCWEDDKYLNYEYQKYIFYFFKNVFKKLK